MAEQKSPEKRSNVTELEVDLKLNEEAFDALVAKCKEAEKAVEDLAAALGNLQGIAKELFNG